VSQAAQLRATMAARLTLCLFATLPLLARAPQYTVTFGSRNFYNYDKTIRPEVASSGSTCSAGIAATTVKVRMYIERWHSVSTKDGTYGFDGYLVAVWTDDRLSYDSTKIYSDSGAVILDGDCTTVMTSSYKMNQVEQDTSKTIWLPDIYFVGQESVEWRDSRAISVYSNGTVHWTRHVRVVLHCTFRLDAFPSDKHMCSFELGVYSQPVTDVVLEWTDVRAPFDSESWSSGSFSIALSQAYAYNTSGTLDENTHSSVVQQVEFTRASAPVYNAYLTNCFVAVLFSFAGFFISAAAVPARVGLGLLTAIFVITNKLGVARLLPSVTYSIFLVDFLVDSFYFCAFSFLEFACVNYGTQCHAWLKAHPRKEEPNATYRATSKVQPEGGPASVSRVEPVDDKEPMDTATAAARKPSRALLTLELLTSRWRLACAKLRHLDVVCRFCFPIAYIIFTAYKFGVALPQYESCADSKCDS